MDYSLIVKIDKRREFGKTNLNSREIKMWVIKALIFKKKSQILVCVTRFTLQNICILIISMFE